MSTQAPTPPAPQETGETSLSTLLSTMKIVAHPTTYVFATIPSSRLADFPIPLSSIILLFREPCTSPPDQTTLIIPETLATTHTIPHIYVCKMLTVNVHSSLEAVGFMAVLATKLAERGISVNPVSGYFHDHLFVPVERAREAVEVLEGLREEAAGEGGQGR